MRKVAITLTVLMLLVVLIGADIRRTEATPTVKPVAKKPCYGYTIIEFGKGVDCNGDTIKLVRVDGIQRIERKLASVE
jgi:hypothetical protein